MQAAGGASMDPRFHGLWAVTAGSAPAPRPLDHDLGVDVAVVGGGYTGLSTALHLAESGEVSVAVLEARDIGFGASGRNAGLVNAGAWLPPDELPARLGDDYGNRLLETLGNAPDLVFEIIRRYGIACEAVRNGNLHCAVGAAGLADINERARQWHARGVPVCILDAKETARLVGSGRFSGAMLDPRAGTIQPLSYARGLAQAAAGLGARIHAATAVTRAEFGATGWRLSTSTGHVVRATRVVVATNTAQEAGPDPWPQLQKALVRLPYFNVATAPLPAELSQRILPQGHGAWDTCKVLSSFRKDAAGRLVYGSVGDVSDRPGDAHVQWVRRCLRQLDPDLARVPIEHRWYGWIDITATHLPYLYQPGPNAWAIFGYNGRGIGPGTVFGRALAELLLGRRTPDQMALPVNAVVPIGFKPLREVFYRSGSKVAHLLSKRF